MIASDSWKWRIRLKRKEQLITLRGKLEIEDNWRALRSLELQESGE
jgi:hypothetical protein